MSSTVSSRWVLDREQTIYSKVKAILISKLKPTYSDLYITDDDETPSDPKFPSVYIHFLQPFERGQDLEGTVVNGVSLTVEVHVTATKAQGMLVAQNVAYEVLDAFKSLHFNATMPEFKNDGSGTKRMIARYERVIGYNDII